MKITSIQQTAIALLALVFVIVPANAIVITFTGASPGEYSSINQNIGDNVNTTTISGIDYGTDYGWTPDIVTGYESGDTKVYRVWPSGASVDNSEVLYTTSSSLAFSFTSEDAGQLAELRGFNTSLYRGTFTADQTIGLTIYGSNADGSNEQVLHNNPSLAVRNDDDPSDDNKHIFAAGTYRAAKIRVVFDLSSLGSGKYSSFGVDDIGLGQVAVPEPSTYALIFGGLALGFVMLRRRFKV